MEKPYGKHKVTIHPRLSGTVRIFNDVPEKISSFVTPICPIFGLVSRICPDTDKLDCFLYPSAAVCLCIGGQKLTPILSVYTKKIAGSQGFIPDSGGGAQDAPPDSHVGPLTTRDCGAGPLDSCL